MGTSLQSWASLGHRTCGVSPRGFLLVVSLQLFGFFATAKQAFCNYKYYYFLGVVLLYALEQPGIAPTPRR